MTERPILFSGAMVRAILQGKKQQTRRIVAESTPADAMVADHGEKLHLKHITQWWTNGRRHWHCIYGQPGDRLWVRETWRPTGTCHEQWTAVLYGADGAHEQRPYFVANLARRNMSPSIHMPRLACRLLLDVVAVRLERLQDISEADALAEGIDAGHDALRQSPVDCYRLLWDSLNAKRAPWSSNPWVWVVEFKREEKC